ncbi:hypothetical protein [Nocardia paucivorans]|uniref:hypothetical protein n=1 Tax=Nocardia paucivorans TaxID=114259 RepID=UPI0002F478AE|nr:hypothetical protein [Nocardia paucivorans]
MITARQLFEVTCDGCGESFEDGEDGAVLFYDVDSARRRVESCGWTVTTDRVRCSDCIARALCALAIHQWGEWAPLDPARPESCVRVCLEVTGGDR